MSRRIGVPPKLAAERADPCPPVSFDMTPNRPTYSSLVGAEVVAYGVLCEQAGAVIGGWDLRHSPRPRTEGSMRRTFS